MRLSPEEKTSIFFQKISSLMFKVEEKRCSSLMRIPSGIFRHCEFEKRLTEVSLAYLRNITLSNLERSADFGRSRLVCTY